MSPSIHEQLMQEVKMYEMPEPARELLADRAPLLLCGVTAAGKNTLAQELIAGGGYEAVVSHTTRTPRENHGVMEVNSVNYFFVSEDDMLKGLRNKQFIEAKSVHGKVYGTSLSAYKAPLERRNIPVLDIDVQGAEEFVKAVPTLRPIFLVPPNFSIWMDRLNSRGVPSNEDLIKRFKSAVHEIGTIMDNPIFELLVNEDKVLTAAMIRSGYVGRSHDAVEIADKLVYDIQKHLETLI